MKPVEFPQQTTIVAENQKEYLPLPAYVDDKLTISCWEFTFWERVQMLFGKKLYLIQSNFGRALQPILPHLGSPFVPNEETE